MTVREGPLAKVVASLSVMRVERCSPWTGAQPLTACHWAVKRVSVWRRLWQCDQVILCLLNIVIKLRPWISLAFLNFIFSIYLPYILKKYSAQWIGGKLALHTDDTRSYGMWNIQSSGDNWEIKSLYVLPIQRKADRKWKTWVHSNWAASLPPVWCPGDTEDMLWCLTLGTHSVSSEGIKVQSIGLQLLFLRCYRGPQGSWLFSWADGA